MSSKSSVGTLSLNDRVPVAPTKRFLAERVVASTEAMAALVPIEASKDSSENRAIMKILDHPDTKSFTPPPVRSGERLSIAVSYGTLIKALVDGTVYPYPRNRGQGDLLGSKEKTIRKTVNSIREDFRPLIFGHPVVCLDPKTGRCMIADGHQRYKGLMELAESGGLSKYVSEECSVDVCHIRNHLELYTMINATQAHTPAERVLNPDLAVGCILTKILNMCQRELKGYLTTKLCYNILYGLHPLLEKKRSPLNYWEVFGAGKKWAKELGTMSAADAPKIKEEHCERVAGAFDYYLEWKQYITQAHLDALSNEDKQQIRTILNSAPLCGIIVLDVVGGMNALVGVKGAKVFSERCLRNKAYLSKSVPAITHGGMGAMSMIIMDIFKRLSPKAPA